MRTRFKSFAVVLGILSSAIALQSPVLAQFNNVITAAQNYSYKPLPPSTSTGAPRSRTSSASGTR